MNCWKCGASVELVPGTRVGNRDVCPQCDFDLKSCRNCRHYDPAKNNQCAETQAEWVRDKEASNYCDYFSPAAGLRGIAPKSNSADDAKKKFDSLFKL